MKRLMLTLVCCTLVAGQATAGTLNVAVLGSSGDPAWSADVQDKLIDTGFFNTVDVIDLTTTTPSVESLLAYDAVLVYTDLPALADPIAFGDHLADYVDQEGGVVVAMYANASLPFGGRFDTDNYWAIVPAGETGCEHDSLGSVHEPASPLMAGVIRFDGGECAEVSTGSLHPSATVVAEWSRGFPLVVRRTIGTAARVDLNFFPPSTDACSFCWLSGTDGDLLMANALVYTGQGGLQAVEATSWGDIKVSFR